MRFKLNFLRIWQHINCPFTLHLIGPFIQEKICKIRRELYHLHVRALHKTRASCINGTRLIWLFIIINLAHPRGITVNSQLPPSYFSSVKLRTESPFNSIEQKQKIIYTGRLSRMQLSNCSAIASSRQKWGGEELFLLHQSPSVSVLLVFLSLTGKPFC